LKQGDLSNTAKLLNLRKLIIQLVAGEGATKPFLRPIGERAEELAKAYEERRLATEAALAEFLRLAEEYVEADVTREAMGVDANTFAIYVTLQHFIPAVESEQACSLNSLFECYPAYEWNDDAQRRLRVELYKTLYPLVGPERLIETSNALIGLQRV
jgi:type I restriction enzyme R subunit